MEHEPALEIQAAAAILSDRARRLEPGAPDLEASNCSVGAVLVGNNHDGAIAALSLRASITCVAGGAGAAGRARIAGRSRITGVAGIAGVTCVARSAGVAGATGIAGVTCVARSAGIAGATHVSLVALCAGIAGVARISCCTSGSGGTCATGHGEYHE